MTNEEAREILHQIRMQKCVTECDYSCKLYESETFCLEEKALDMAIKALEQTGWIPVNERLPEDEQEILFSTKTGRVQIGKYHDDDSANQWYSYRDKCRAWNNVVTAWMPLPELYAESEEKE